MKDIAHYNDLIKSFIKSEIYICVSDAFDWENSKKIKEKKLPIDHTYDYYTYQTKRGPVEFRRIFKQRNETIINLDTLFIRLQEKSQQAFSKELITCLQQQILSSLYPDHRLHMHNSSHTSHIVIEPNWNLKSLYLSPRSLAAESKIKSDSQQRKLLRDVSINNIIHRTVRESKKGSFSEFTGMLDRNFENDTELNLSMALTACSLPPTLLNEINIAHDAYCKQVHTLPYPHFTGDTAKGDIAEREIALSRSFCNHFENSLLETGFFNKQEQLGLLFNHLRITHPFAFVNAEQICGITTTMHNSAIEYLYNEKTYISLVDHEFHEYLLKMEHTNLTLLCEYATSGLAPNRIADKHQSLTELLSDKKRQLSLISESWQHRVSKGDAEVVRTA
ncbi:MAG: hypothetical protein IPP74_02225 [Alphaproteobacteria bacterium]|nr:hypothetical protein [Alphaproteobacteria bacterium]